MSLLSKMEQESWPALSLISIVFLGAWRIFPVWHLFLAILLECPSTPGFLTLNNQTVSGPFSYTVLVCRYLTRFWSNISRKFSWTNFTPVILSFQSFRFPLIVAHSSLPAFLVLDTKLATLIEWVRGGSAIATALLRKSPATRYLFTRQHWKRGARKTNHSVKAQLSYGGDA